MYKKLLVAAVLIAFVGVQLSHSLECHECNKRGPCTTATIVKCDPKSAQTTHGNLNLYFQNVPPFNATNTTNYACLHTQHPTSGKVGLEIRGCVNEEVHPCSLNVSASIGNGTATCHLCKADMCNKLSPAAAASASLFTLLASVLGVMIVKGLML